MRTRSQLSRRAFNFLLACPALAPVLQDEYIIRDNLDLVLLDVSVRDHRGQYVIDLPQAAFHIWVDNQPQIISTFNRADAPVTVGLIVDDSGSMRSKKPEVVVAGLAFAKESNPRDEFFVVNFNDHVVPGLPPGVAFTDDIQMLHQALYMGQPQGRTALYDAIAFGLRHLEDGHHENRTLIVVSDGGDNVSSIRENKVLQLINASRATVFTIGLVDPDDRDLRPGVLKEFANISGGIYYQPDQVPDVINVMRNIAGDIRHRYTIGFSPRDVSRQRSTHQIKVAAARDGRSLVVRTRRSYTSYLPNQSTQA